MTNVIIGSPQQTGLKVDNGLDLEQTESRYQDVDQSRALPCLWVELGLDPDGQQIGIWNKDTARTEAASFAARKPENGSHESKRQEVNELGSVRQGIDQLDEVLETLSNTLSIKEKRKAVQTLEGTKAQILIDFLYHLLSLPHLPESAPAWLRKHSLIVLRKLCGNSLQYPQCYTLCGIKSLSYEGMGGFCDIYRAQCPRGHHLCLKVIRIQSKSDVRNIFKVYARESILWGQLHHPNVLPFYGVFYLDEAYQRVCLVSPWIEDGNIVAYLRKNPQASRKPLIHDVAHGLKYLHDENVIHGDLKGMNVLVDQLGRACVADFGFSRVRTNETFGWITTTALSGRTTRWASPELLGDGSIPTRASDVWAFGCVCYEIQTRLMPFHNCTMDGQIVLKLVQRELPACPGADIHLKPMDRVDGAMWRLIQWCWQFEPASRPTCAQILGELAAESTSSLSEPTEESPAVGDLSYESSCSWNVMRRSAAAMPVDLGQVLRVLKGTYTESRELQP